MARGGGRKCSATVTKTACTALRSRILTDFLLNVYMKSKHSCLYTFCRKPAASLRNPGRKYPYMVILTVSFTEGATSQKKVERLSRKCGRIDVSAGHIVGAFSYFPQACGPLLLWDELHARVSKSAPQAYTARNHFFLSSI